MASLHLHLLFTDVVIDLLISVKTLATFFTFFTHYKPEHFVSCLIVSMSNNWVYHVEQLDFKLHSSCFIGLWSETEQCKYNHLDDPAQRSTLCP